MTRGASHGYKKRAGIVLVAVLSHEPIVNTLKNRLALQCGHTVDRYKSMGVPKSVLCANCQQASNKE